MTRETLTKEHIVKAAVDLLDSQGVDGLSMRNLGKRLGMAATSVYWHIDSKESVLSLAADRVWGEIVLPEYHAKEWLDAAHDLAWNTYSVAVQHPWLVSAMTDHFVYGPNRARHQNHCYAILEHAGFTDEHLDAAIDVIFTFVLGAAMAASTENTIHRAIQKGGPKSRHIKNLIEEASQTAAQFPRLHARLANTAHTPDNTRQTLVERVLRTILKGLERQSRSAE